MCQCDLHHFPEIQINQEEVKRKGWRRRRRREQLLLAGFLMSRNKSEVVFQSRQSGFIISFQQSTQRFGLIASAAAAVPAAPPPPLLPLFPPFPPSPTVCYTCRVCGGVEQRLVIRLSLGRSRPPGTIDGRVSSSSWRLEERLTIRHGLRMRRRRAH